MHFQIRYVINSDKKFWFSLDKHLSVAEFDKKVRDKQGYVLCLSLIHISEPTRRS